MEWGQVFLYEKKKDEAVLWRCFSQEERAVVPGQICGLAVTELAPYCFSAHMDGETLEKGLKEGRLCVCSGEMSEPAVPLELLGTGDIGFKNGIGTLEGLPPLAGNALKELVIPDGVRRVGRYCLYNCDSLELLEFGADLSDWGSGVFTGCHQIKKIRLRLGKDGRSSLKQVLDEVPEALVVEFLTDASGPEDVREGSGWEDPGFSDDISSGSRCAARLVFPGFYEEGVENTPARILETHVHGSGILYRNCFQNKVFDFRQYDRLFPYTVAREPFEIAARMAAGRLWLPHGLTEEARLQYEEFAAARREEFARLFVQERDMRGIRWLVKLAGTKHPDIVGFLLTLAGEARFVEAVSFLMEARANAGERRPARRRRFEL